MTSTASTTVERNVHSTHEREEAAVLYVEQLRVFLAHAAAFGAGMVVMFMVNLATNVAAGITGHFSAWWSFWAFVGWGAGIAVHGLVVRLNRPSPAVSPWEERQRNKVLGR